jgi:hypothetical protein
MVDDKLTPLEMFDKCWTPDSGYTKTSWYRIIRPALEELTALRKSLGESMRVIKEQADEIERYRKRLEINHAYDIDGKKVPFPQGGADGIECRDATIRLLEDEIERLKDALRFYGTEYSWEPQLTGLGIRQSNINKDQGQRARKALGGTNEQV